MIQSTAPLFKGGYQSVRPTGGFSIIPLAFYIFIVYNISCIRRYDGIGRRDGLKIRW